MLNAHSHIYCGPEVKFFRDFYGDYLGDPLRHLRFFRSARSVLSEEELLDLLGQAFIHMHERAAHQAAKPRWADKNPENVLYLAQWQRLLGDAWLFVHVVRNPLDTLASIKEAEFPLSIPATLEERVAFYLRYLQAGLDFAQANPDRYYRVVYDQLVSCPETVLAGLMKWLGEAFEGGQLEFNEFPQQKGLEDPKISRTSDIHTLSLGRWATVLSREEAVSIWQKTKKVWALIDPEDGFGLSARVVPVGESHKNNYERMSAREINSERFDQAPDSLPGRVTRYIICSTQRSGSYLLCRQLINAGIGVPQEYFNPLHRKLLCRRWNLDPRDKLAYLHLLFARRTTPNGVWGSKLHWRQYTKNRPAIEQELLHAARYLFVYRTDVNAQAVSLHIALATGIWGFDGIRTRPGKLDFRLDDLDHVAQCTRMIDRQNQAWLDFFASRQITPLAIRYEDFVADQQGFVGQIAEFLGLDAAAYQVPPPEARENHFPPEIDAVRQELMRRCRPAAEATLDR